MSQSSAPIPKRLDRHIESYAFIEPQQFRDTLVDQVAVVTGAGRGIGRAIALAFAQAGAHVVCVARTRTEVGSLVDLIESLHLPRAEGICADVTSESDIEAIFRETNQAFGTVDILVNNAGIDRIGSMQHEKDFSAWWRVFEVNMKAPAALTRQVLPDMMSRNSGTIIHIGSRNAIYDHPFMTAYSSSKAALLRFHECLHLELEGSNVKTFYLQPGDVATSLMEQGFNHDELQKIPRLGSMVSGMQERMSSGRSHSPQLAADTCVALAALPEAALLSGLYLDANDDLGQILSDIKSGQHSRIIKRNMYKLKADVL
ncbi:hypothetical protein F66182_8489 [Fusarium sp. NRRL 66182]|nr:hypothetical protein F66182_8489 [Fusarium sp. NRRL 66182]